MHAPSSEFLHDKEGVKSVVKLLALNRGLSGPTLRSQASHPSRALHTCISTNCIPPPVTSTGARASPDSELPRARERLRIISPHSRYTAQS